MQLQHINIIPPTYHRLIEFCERMAELRKKEGNKDEGSRWLELAHDATEITKRYARRSSIDRVSLKEISEQAILSDCIGKDFALSERDHQLIEERIRSFEEAKLELLDEEQKILDQYPGSVHAIISSFTHPVAEYRNAEGFPSSIPLSSFTTLRNYVASDTWDLHKLNLLEYGVYRIGYDQKLIQSYGSNYLSDHFVKEYIVFQSKLEDIFKTKRKCFNILAKCILEIYFKDEFQGQDSNERLLAFLKASDKELKRKVYNIIVIYGLAINMLPNRDIYAKGPSNVARYFTGLRDMVAKDIKRSVNTFRPLQCPE